MREIIRGDVNARASGKFVQARLLLRDTHIYAVRLARSSINHMLLHCSSLIRRLLLHCALILHMLQLQLQFDDVGVHPPSK
jgi:hypothetical protein